MYHINQSISIYIYIYIFIKAEISSGKYELILSDTFYAKIIEIFISTTFEISTN